MFAMPLWPCLIPLQAMALQSRCFALHLIEPVVIDSLAPLDWLAKYILNAPVGWYLCGLIFTLMTSSSEGSSHAGSISVVGHIIFCPSIAIFEAHDVVFP